MDSRINIRRVGNHLLFWTVYTLYEFFNYSWDNRMGLEFRYAVYLWTDIPLMAILVYTNLYGLMPRYFYTRRYVLYIGLLITAMLAAGVCCWFMAVHVWLPWLHAHSLPDAMFGEAPLVCILQNFIELYPVMALTMLLKIRNNDYTNEKRLRAIEHEKFNAELNSLKAQLHPHFFFNTLNSIYSLTLKRSEQSPAIVLRLSELMHYILYEANGATVLLENDLHHLKNYIGIEQTRFADRLDLSFQYSGDIEQKTIVPLLLLPFVENAFKHSLVNELDKAWITIDLKVSGTQLFFKTANTYQSPAAAPTHTGVGLNNVRRRLELTYPGRHELHIAQQENVFTVDLKLQLYEPDQVPHSG